MAERATGQQSNICGPCWQLYSREYYRKNKDRLNRDEKDRNALRRQNPEWVESERKRGREFWRKLRHEAIMAYGGYRCACCGETEPMFLSIDHVFNDGASHRRAIAGHTENNGKGASGHTMVWLKRHNYPAGFQVLCMNCNFGKAINGGVCPHKTSQANRVKTGEAQTG